MNGKHKCPEKGRFLISSVAHSSPSLSDPRRHVHKSLILSGLTKIPFQNKQPPRGSEHPEVSPTVNVRAQSVLGPQRDASSWASWDVCLSSEGLVLEEWSQLWPWIRYVVCVFFFFKSIYFMTTGTLDWPVTTCHLGMWHPLRPPHKISRATRDSPAEPADERLIELRRTAGIQ